MELKEEGTFELRGFSPHALAFLPALNCLLATDSQGRARYLDLASRAALPTSGTAAIARVQLVGVV